LRRVEPIGSVLDEEASLAKKGTGAALELTAEATPTLLLELPSPKTTSGFYCQFV
jgi:hypothetical protein